MTSGVVYLYIGGCWHAFWHGVFYVMVDIDMSTGVVYVYIATGMAMFAGRLCVF